jgi:hypothetical protein
MSDEQSVHAYADWPEADEELDAAVPELCACLRTKTAFGSLVGSTHSWRQGKSSTAVYWCLATMGNSGPDEEFAHPHKCQSGRKCYRGPE